MIKSPPLLCRQLAQSIEQSLGSNPGHRSLLVRAYYLEILTSVMYRSRNLGTILLRQSRLSVMPSSEADLEVRKTTA